MFLKLKDGRLLNLFNVLSFDPPKTDPILDELLEKGGRKPTNQTFIQTTGRSLVTDASMEEIEQMLRDQGLMPRPPRKSRAKSAAVTPEQPARHVSGKGRSRLPR